VTEVLMRGHGDAVVGPSLQVAVFRAIYTEVNANLQIQATMLGGPITFLNQYEAQKSQGMERTWEAWKRQALERDATRRWAFDDPAELNLGQAVIAAQLLISELQRRLRRPASSPFSEEPVFSGAVSFGISASENITFALHQGIPNTAKGCSV
jgi:hypothetical protein